MERRLADTVVVPPAVSALGRPAESLRPSAEEALKWLQEGNARYVAGARRPGDLDAARRAETVRDGQHPLATIVACSDSRVPPEIVLDQGIGRLFVIRVAGNVCGPEQVASLEFAVGSLETPLIVVMGHTHCSAVAVAMGAEKCPINMSVILERMRPAVAKVKRECLCLDDAHLWELGVEANAWQTIDDLLEESRLVREQVASGKLSVAAAKYDTLTGRVHWLGQRRFERWGY